MPEVKVVLTNPLGLHARSAAKLVDLAGQFKSVVTIASETGDKSADARSILSIMEIGARCGSAVIIRAVGDDEEAAVSALTELFESGFGEI